MTREAMARAIGGQLRAAIAASRRRALTEAEIETFLEVILAYADAHAAAPAGAEAEG